MSEQEMAKHIERQRAEILRLDHDLATANNLLAHATRFEVGRYVIHAVPWKGGAQEIGGTKVGWCVRTPNGNALGTIGTLDYVMDEHGRKVMPRADAIAFAKLLDAKEQRP